MIVHKHVDKTPHIADNCGSHTQMWYDYIHGGKCPTCGVEAVVEIEDVEVESNDRDFVRLKSDLDKKI